MLHPVAGADLVPALCEDLLSAVDQPLKVQKDEAAGREYLLRLQPRRRLVQAGAGDLVVRRAGVLLRRPARARARRAHRKIAVDEQVQPPAGRWHGSPEKLRQLEIEANRSARGPWTSRRGRQRWRLTRRAIPPRQRVRHVPRHVLRGRRELRVSMGPGGRQRLCGRHPHQEAGERRQENQGELGARLARPTNVVLTPARGRAGRVGLDPCRRGP